MVCTSGKYPELIFFAPSELIQVAAYTLSTVLT